MRGPLLLAALVLALAAPAAWAQPAVPEAFTSRDKGHCGACHMLPPGIGSENRSDLGPRLEGARMRALGRAGVRAAIEDPTRTNPDTLMPPFGRHRILDKAEIDRLVEFLLALP